MKDIPNVVVLYPSKIQSEMTTHATASGLHLLPYRFSLSMPQGVRAKINLLI
jgi:hypothetical protein